MQTNKQTNKKMKQKNSFTSTCNILVLPTAFTIVFSPGLGRIGPNNRLEYLDELVYLSCVEYLLKTKVMLLRKISCLGNVISLLSKILTKTMHSFHFQSHCFPCFFQFLLLKMASCCLASRYLVTQ